MGRESLLAGSDAAGRRFAVPSGPRRRAVNLKTALLAVTAVAALLGAAIIGVPSTSDKTSDTPYLSTAG